jgi:hypothetical protein
MELTHSKQSQLPLHRGKRALTGVLFFLGLPWALLAWFFIPTPLGIFMPRYQYGAHDVIASLVASAGSGTGYFVWFGWGWFTLKGRFPLLRWRSFWLLSLFQHCAWLVIFPLVREENVVDFLGSSEMLLLKIWTLGNAIIASSCALAQHGAAPNGGQGTQPGNSGVTEGPPSVS